MWQVKYMDKIIVKGARENNLKNVNIELPKNKYDWSIRKWKK